MLNKQVRILNFDDSIIHQKQIISNFKNSIVDFKDLGPKARYWLSSKIRGIVQERIKDSQKNAITFLGSGDFHHISELLISQFSEPLTVIIFDFHPDWDTSLARLNCGAWVNTLAKKKNILKVLLIGVSSQDINSFRINSGNLGALNNDFLEIYPYEHVPSRAFLKSVPSNISLRVDRGIVFNTIYWQELKNKDLKSFFGKILERIAVKNVYVSIDKDCLKPDYALTNWEEGKLSLDELLLMLKLIRENLNIVGLDITGDYSDIRLSSIIKKIASYLDHPKDVKAAKLSPESINALNQATNIKILELFN